MSELVIGRIKQLTQESPKVLVVGSGHAERDLKSENMLLRQLLWLNHGCHAAALYGDDGEMQCSACLVDFKRDSADKIMAAFTRRSAAALAAEQSNAQEQNRCQQVQR
jgi:hypothetical protein